MAVSAVWRLVCFLAPSPSEPKEQTAAHRRDALCPSTKIQKQAAFGMTSNQPLGQNLTDFLCDGFEDSRRRAFGMRCHSWSTSITRLANERLDRHLAEQRHL